MINEAIRSKVIDIVVATLQLDDQAKSMLTNSRRIDHVAQADSIAILELVLALEEEFGIRIEPDHISVEVIYDLDRVVAYIESQQVGSDQSSKADN